MSDLLRVTRKGLIVKSMVDDAIDRAGIVYNLRDAIEEGRTRADQATDEKEKRKHAQKGNMLSKPQINTANLTMSNAHPGLQNLHRYFALIVFQAYLQSTAPDTRKSFETIETFIQNQPGKYDNEMPHN